MWNKGLNGRSVLCTIAAKSFDLSPGYNDLQVMRDGKAMNLKVPGMSSPELVNRHRAPGSVPSYYIVGGVVFTPLTCGLLDVAVEVISEEAWQSGRGAIKEQGQQIVCTLILSAQSLNMSLCP